jgi:hypothetical protein
VVTFTARLITYVYQINMSVTPGGTVWMVKMKRIVVRKTWGKVYKFLFKWQSFYYLDWYLTDTPENISFPPNFHPSPIVT